MDLIPIYVRYPYSIPGVSVGAVCSYCDKGRQTILLGAGDGQTSRAHFLGGWFVTLCLDGG